jgi:hypothetical protein
VPLEVELGALDQLTPTAVFAHFDGSGASGTFLPCVTYYTQDGKVFARSFPASSVAAGASADVSWFPGLSVPASAIPTTGVFYDITNTGASLVAQATNLVELDATNGSMFLTSFNGDIWIQPFGVNGATPAQLIVQAQGAISVESGIGTAAGLSSITINADGDLILRCNGTNHILLTGGPVQYAATTQVGFFGATPVNKAAAPVTLADVITILRNLGLCS